MKNKAAILYRKEFTEVLELRYGSFLSPYQNNQDRLGKNIVIITIES